MELITFEPITDLNENNGSSWSWIMGTFFSSNQSAADLLSPCMEGNLHEVKRLIGIYIADHRCSCHSSSDPLAAFISTADPTSGNTAIHGAAFSGQLDILTFLLDACYGGEKPIIVGLSLKNGLGCSPLWVAAGYDKVDCLQYLIEKLHDSQQLESELLDGNNTGDTPFLAAASRGNIRSCRCLLDAANEKCTALCRTKMLRTANLAGDTALNVVISSGHDVELLKLLLDMDNRCQQLLDKNHVVDNSPEDANHDVNGLNDLASLRSKCIHRKNRLGLSPLIIACERNYPSILELLLEYGADIQVKDMTGRSPLAVAAFCGCKEVVGILIHHFDSASFSTSNSMSYYLNEKDIHGCTPLWLATRTGNLSMVKQLVDAGADVALRNCEGMTPLDVAIQFRKNDIAEFLRNHTTE